MVSKRASGATLRPAITVNRQLSNLLSQLAALLREDEEDEYGRLRPTDFSYQATLVLALNVAAIMKAEFPYGHAATDQEGAIRVTWRRGDKVVRLGVPASEGGRYFLYHDQGESYDLQEQVTPRAVAQRLAWLSE